MTKNCRFINETFCSSYNLFHAFNQMNVFRPFPYRICLWMRAAATEENVTSHHKLSNKQRTNMQLYEANFFRIQIYICLTSMAFLPREYLYLPQNIHFACCWLQISVHTYKSSTVKDSFTYIGKELFTVYFRITLSTSALSRCLESFIYSIYRKYTVKRITIFTVYHPERTACQWGLVPHSQHGRKFAAQSLPRQLEDAQIFRLSSICYSCSLLPRGILFWNSCFDLCDLPEWTSQLFSPVQARYALFRSRLRM